MFANLPHLGHDPITAGDFLRLMLSFFLPIESTRCSGYPALLSASLHGGGYKLLSASPAMDLTE